MKFTYKAQVIYADYSFLLLLFLFITTACIITIIKFVQNRFTTTFQIYNYYLCVCIFVY